MNQKLIQSKVVLKDVDCKALIEADLLKEVVLKLLVVVKVDGEEALVEANLLKDVVVKLLVILVAKVGKADGEAVVDKEAVLLFFADLLLQALWLVDLSQAPKAKLKLIQVQAVSCKGDVEGLVSEAPPES